MAARWGNQLGVFPNQFVTPISSPMTLAGGQTKHLMLGQHINMFHRVTVVLMLRVRNIWRKK